MTCLPSSVVAARSEPTSAFLPVLETVVGLLDDQADHPEIWAATCAR